VDSGPRDDITGQLQIQECSHPSVKTTPEGKVIHVLQARSWRLSCFVRGSLK
jgi:hypothetical protein